MPEPWQEAGFGIYLHWPFCQAKCPYCDFNSHVATTIDQTRWKAAYLQEIRRYGAELEGRVVRSIFFGGGTPSLMDTDLVDAVLNEIRATWVLANDCEITLEANPTSVEAGRFEGYRSAGVNRVSLGVQALNDDALRTLGRLHTAKEALAALHIAKSVFERVSFDLIYARQDQSLSNWTAELSQALALQPDHLSLYQLTIEENTAFGDRLARGRLGGLPDDDLSADMFFATQDICETAGLPAYEISNHAKPGQESRHNLIYWQSGDWIGIGPGAHGRLSVAGQRLGTATELDPLGWLRLVETQGSGETERDVLGVDDTDAERVLMGLRTVAGVRLDLLKDKKLILNINKLVSSSILKKQENRICVDPEFRPVLNAVIRDILHSSEP